MLGGMFGAGEALPRLQGNAASPLVPAALARLNPGRQSENDLTDLKVDGKKFTCTYKGKALTGELNPNGEIISVEGISDFKVTLESGVAQKNLPALFKNIEAATGRFGEIQPGPGTSLRSPDGWRFYFEAGEDKARFVSTPDDLFKIQSTPTPEQQSAFSQAKMQLANERAAIASELSAGIDAQYRSELTLRGKRAALLARVKEVYSSMDEMTRQRDGHPQMVSTWEAYRADFKSKTDTYVDYLKKYSPAQTGTTNFNDALQKLDNIIKPFESNLHLTPLPLDSYSDRETLDILERLERSKALNERHEALTAAFNKKLGTLANGSVENYNTQVERNALESAWQTTVNEFQRGFGWDRWDPMSLSRDDHRKVSAKLDRLLSTYEEKLEIKPARTEASVLESFDKRLRSLDERLEHLNKTRDITSQSTLVDQRNGKEISEIQDPENRQSFRRILNIGNLTATDFFENGKLVKRAERTGDFERTTTLANPNQHLMVDEWLRDSSGWHLLKRSEAFPNGVQKVSDAKTHTLEYLDSSARPAARVSYDEKGGIKERVMLDGKGGSIGNYAFEKAKNGELTPGAYLDMLGERAGGVQRLHIYLELFMQYTSDNGDHWQTSSETVQRLKDGKMLGDCDDYAFLARDILRRQGIQAQVVYIPTPAHAICMWAEKRSDGRYDAHAICTYGYDRNGIRFFADLDPEKDKGYATLNEALNSLMKKYAQAGVGVQQGQTHTISPNSISIMDISPEGVRSYTTRTEDYLLIQKNKN
jgi:hypothetical protein